MDVQITPACVSFVMRRFTLALFLFALPLFADQQFTSSDGVTLHYHTIGKGTPVIVLSGGPGMTVEYMEPVGRVVSKHAKAVMLEQRGTGNSALQTYDPTTITVAKVVEDIDALRTHLGLDKITLLGHSWGGMLAMAYAAAHPDRVAKLVLVEPGGPTLDFAEGFGKRLEANYTTEDLDGLAYWRDAERKKANPRHATAEALRVKTPAYFADRRKAREFVKLINDKSYDSRVNSVLFADMRKSFDLRNGLHNVTAPVFIVQSRQDPVQATDDITAAMPHAKVLWIDHAGHYPWIEQPAAFARAIAASLR